MGTHDAVEVPDAGIIAERDVPVEVADEVAVRLLEQRDNWAKSKDAKAENTKAVS